MAALYKNRVKTATDPVSVRKYKVAITLVEDCIAKITDDMELSDDLGLSVDDVEMRDEKDMEDDPVDDDEADDMSRTL